MEVEEDPVILAGTNQRVLLGKRRVYVGFLDLDLGLLP